MFVVECPEGASGRRLVSERRISGMAAVPEGWALTVTCPCGREHLTVVRRLETAVPQPRQQEVRGAQVVG